MNSILLYIILFIVIYLCYDIIYLNIYKSNYIYKSLNNNNNFINPYNKYNKSNNNIKSNNKSDKSNELNANYIFVDDIYNIEYVHLLNCIKTLNTNKFSFNTTSLPVEKKIPNKSQEYCILNQIMLTINYKIISKSNLSFDKKSKWSNYFLPKNMESGWEKLQKKLNLPSNLYDQNSSVDIIKIYDILYVNLYETDKEQQYIYHLICHKNNSKYKIILKINIVINKPYSDNIMIDDNTKSNNNSDNNNIYIYIENIQILGYLLDYTSKYKDKLIKNNIHNKYINYDKFRMFEDNEIKYILNNKFLNNKKEMGNLY
jgi:hypothetical protein